MFSESILCLAEKVLENCRATGFKLVTAESCTGGLIAGCLTGVAGSSDVIDRGFVTYTNKSKCQMLGVPAILIDSVGAVSEQVACAMAEGAIKHSDGDISISVTGIAGPGGGSNGKPVGLVHMAVGLKGHQTLHERHFFLGGRTTVRKATVENSLLFINNILSK
jgi:nicotinamide-nucleotide amidase